MAISNMSVEMGAKAGYIPPDEKTLEYLRAHGSSRPYVLLYPDGDAVYERSYIHDAAALAPQGEPMYTWVRGAPATCVTSWTLST